MNTMTVKDIEHAIARLPHSDMVELSVWFDEFESQLWDEQIENDANTGRFDALISQAKAEYDAGRSEPL